MNNFLGIMELRTFYTYYKNEKLKAINFSGQTNILCRHSFCDIVKITKKFLPFPLLEITTKSTYFPPAKKKIPILWIDLQTNKSIKGLKTIYLNNGG